MINPSIDPLRHNVWSWSLTDQRWNIYRPQSPPSTVPTLSIEPTDLWLWTFACLWVTILKVKIKTWSVWPRSLMEDSFLVLNEVWYCLCHWITSRFLYNADDWRIAHGRHVRNCVKPDIVQHHASATVQGEQFNKLKRQVSNTLSVSISRKPTGGCVMT